MVIDKDHHFSLVKATDSAVLLTLRLAPKSTSAHLLTGLASVSRSGSSLHLSSLLNAGTHTAPFGATHSLSFARTWSFAGCDTRPFARPHRSTWHQDHFRHVPFAQTSSTDGFGDANDQGS